MNLDYPFSGVFGEGPMDKLFAEYKFYIRTTSPAMKSTSFVNRKCRYVESLELSGRRADWYGHEEREKCQLYNR